MKNLKLFKVLGITILIVMLLTWFIPSSTFDGSSVTRGAIEPAGIWNWFSDLDITIRYFWQFGVFILAIGAFYGVANKTGALKVLVNKLASAFKKKEKLFLIITITLFMFITAATGIYLPLMIFIPLFMAIILSLGYSKVIAIVSTIGATIIGTMSLIFNDLVNQVLTIKDFPNIWYQVVLFVLTLVVTIIYVIKTSHVKDEDKDETDNLILIDKSVESTPKKKKLWPLLTMLAILFVLLIIGLMPWLSMFNVDIFNKFYNTVIGVKIGNFAIFKSIFGSTIVALGKWGLIDYIAVLTLAAVTLAIMYRIKAKEAFEGFIDGAKKFASAALLVVLVNFVIVLTLNSGFYTTVINWLIGLTKVMNLVTMSLVTFFGGVLSIDNLYVANYNMSIISGIVAKGTSMSYLAFINQTMYGLAMLIAPTSIMLLAGLAFLKVSYKSWLKYIWQLLLILLVIVFVILTIIPNIDYLYDNLLMVIIIVIAVLYLISVIISWRALKKTNKPIWLTLIPVYNIIVMLQKPKRSSKK